MSAIRQFKAALEVELDKGFPKIHEEGEAKRLNKRGEALGLFATAVMGAQQIMLQFGNCETCWGKGHVGDENSMIFCRCERGKELKAYFDKAFKAELP